MASTPSAALTGSDRQTRPFLSPLAAALGLWVEEMAASQWLPEGSGLGMEARQVGDESLGDSGLDVSVLTCTACAPSRLHEASLSSLTCGCLAGRSALLMATSRPPSGERCLVLSSSHSQAHCCLGHTLPAEEGVLSRIPIHGPCAPARPRQGLGDAGGLGRAGAARG